MPSLNAFLPQEVMAFFHPEGRHIPLQMSELPEARVAWVNQRVMRQDPAFVACGGTFSDYKTHLLRSCAYVVAPQQVECESSAIGVADRYGGSGIGNNGGSGRAVVMNGYHIKGVGRTPLVSVLSEEAHASGGAYLEECVRETIFSELVAAEFPGGAVPTLAIIDTGLIQWWNEDAGPRAERRCLLVRPAFLRPAHFERAVAHINTDPVDGYSDARRVDDAFRIAKELWGHGALLEVYQKFWLAWAEQLAYGFIHRLPHGGDSTSNIAMDGSLLDFGGMTAIPSWARISLMWGGPPVGEGLFYLSQAVKNHATALGRCVDSSLMSPEAVRATILAATFHYRRVVLREMLRVAGVTRNLAEFLIQEHPETAQILGRLLFHYQREQFAIFDGTPCPRFAWDQALLWSDEPPTHWRALRDFLQTWIEQSRRADLRQVSGCSMFRGRSRPALYREHIKKELYEDLEQRLKGDALCQDSLDRLITKWVCHHRRDSLIEPSDAIPIGFARNATAGYALFRNLSDSRLFAVPEWRADSGVFGTNAGIRLPLRRVTEEMMVFDVTAVSEFCGTISVYLD